MVSKRGLMQSRARTAYARMIAASSMIFFSFSLSVSAIAAKFTEKDSFEDQRCDPTASSALFRPKRGCLLQLVLDKSSKRVIRLHRKQVFKTSP